MLFSCEDSFSVDIDKINFNKEGDEENLSTKNNFSLSAEQLREELINELMAEKVTDEYDWTYSKYSYVDHKDGMIFAHDREDNWKLCGFEFSKSGDKISINFESKRRMKIEFVEFEGDDNTITEFERVCKDVFELATEKQTNIFTKKESELKANFDKKEIKLKADFETKTFEINTSLETIKTEFEQYKKDYSTPNTEVEQLAEFKNQKLNDERKTAESTLFAQFDEVLSENEDYKKIKETSKNFTIEDIESQCLILFGKENMKLKSYTVVSSKSNKTKIWNCQYQLTKINTRK